MRPVESNWYRDFIYNLTNTKNRYDNAISESTSGKKLNHLSDNPSDMSYVLSLRSKLNQIDQYDKNIESGLGFLNTADSALNTSQNLMYSIVSLAEQGASDGTDAEARRILADRVDEMRNELMNYANTEVMGKFVFAGSATDTQPYTKAADTVVGGITIPGVITYNGNNEDIDIQADFSVTVTTNTPGSQIFGDSTVAVPPPYDVFQRLSDLVVALRQNNTTAIGNEISNMSELINQFGEAMGAYGNRSAHLTEIKGMLKSFSSSLEAKMSSLEDANMAESISNLSREEVGLQAVLQAGARIQRYSLMNYLG
jgi:flagellar hook-associated protein 3 FlgL